MQTCKYFLYVSIYLIIVPGLILALGLFLLVIAGKTVLSPDILRLRVILWASQCFYIVTMPLWVCFGLAISRRICSKLNGNFIPQNFLARYLPFYLPLIYLLLLLTIYFSVDEKAQEKAEIFALITHLHYIGLLFPMMFVAPWHLAQVGVTLMLSYGVGGTLFLRKATDERAKHRNAGVTILLLILLLPSMFVGYHYYEYRQKVLPVDFFTTVISDSEDQFSWRDSRNRKKHEFLSGYDLFAPFKELKQEAEQAGLGVSCAEKLGSTGFRQGGFVLLTQEKIPDLYFTFCTDSELPDSSTRTPIAKDALVFFVHRDNPLDDLSVETIREIYSGQITTWEPLLGKAGGTLGHRRILPFQNSLGAESQDAMTRMMNGVTLSDPLQIEYRGGMGGCDVGLAYYHNYRNAIGYSFRYFITELCPSRNEIKILRIDGVEPTKENIRNGSYPLIETLSIVSSESPTDEDTQKLIDWLLSPQGQELIEKAGFVPLKAE